MTDKHCPLCKQDLPYSAFYRLNGKKITQEPYGTYCKTCDNKRLKKHRPQEHYACQHCARLFSKKRRDTSKRRDLPYCADCKPVLSLCANTYCFEPARGGKGGKFCVRHSLMAHGGRDKGDRLSADVIMSLVGRYANGVCEYTGEPFTDSNSAELDHRMPRSLGGSQAEDNLFWTTRRFNTFKSGAPAEALPFLIVAYCTKHGLSLPPDLPVVVPLGPPTSKFLIPLTYTRGRGVAPATYAVGLVPSR